MKIKLKQFITLCTILVCIINATGCANFNTSEHRTNPESSLHNKLKNESNETFFDKKKVAIGAGTIIVLGVITIVLATMALNGFASGIAANSAHGA